MSYLRRIPPVGWRNHGLCPQSAARRDRFFVAKPSSARQARRLLVTSGALAASDPFVFPDPPPFTQAIPAGRYPVSVAIACFGEGDESDERVAFARVELSNLPVVSWAMAVTERQDPATLE